MLRRTKTFATQAIQWRLQDLRGRVRKKTWRNKFGIREALNTAAQGSTIERNKYCYSRKQ